MHAEMRRIGKKKQKKKNYDTVRTNALDPAWRIKKKNTSIRTLKTKTD